MIPTRCRWSCCGVGDPPAHDAWLGPRERAVQAGFKLPRRRADWRMGRWAAKWALAGYLDAMPGRSAVSSLSRLEIMAAEDGAPEPLLDGTPLPASVSISHREELGASLVAPAGVRLGIDLERIEPRSTRMMGDFFTPLELERVLSALPGRDRHKTAALTWSAKESLLKVLRTGLRRDTRSVELVLAEVEPRRDWKALVMRDLQSGEDHHGWWRTRGELMITLVANPRELAPPRAIHQAE